MRANVEFKSKGAAERPPNQSVSEMNYSWLPRVLPDDWATGAFVAVGPRRGGRLIGALTDAGLPRLVRVERAEDGELREELGPGLRIAPLASGVAATL